MKNTNIVISLDKRRMKKDGSYPLIMRLGHHERTTSIPIGVSLNEKDWDDSSKLVKKSYVGLNSVSRLNNLIQKKKADAMDILLKLDEANQLDLLSITDLKDKILNQHSKLSFFQYGEQQVQDLLKTGRIGTARSYSGVLKVLRRFNGGKDLFFEQITFSYLTKFENNHRSNGNGTNGLAVYMRTIRAIYNKAIKEGFVEKELYPFNDYKIKTAPTEKRALEWDLLKEIMSLELKQDHICFNARNYFLASYMMYGMNFTDMAFLLKSDIVNGRIIYRRKKTSKVYDIKITESLQTILNYYITKNPELPYIFPIIKRADSLNQAKDIQWARKRYNKKLKKLAEMCGIESNLTSYVSRHSFATQAMLLDVPLNAISSMLGHSSLKTTQVYLKSLPSNILDDYNDAILSRF